MEYQDEKIDYTNYLRGRPLETDQGRVDSMRKAVLQALAERGLRGAQMVKCDCYADGCVRVEVNTEFYGMFDCFTGKFFDGFVGDR